MFFEKTDQRVAWALCKVGVILDRYEPYDSSKLSLPDFVDNSPVASEMKQIDEYSIHHGLISRGGHKHCISSAHLPGLRLLQWLQHVLPFVINGSVSRQLSCGQPHSTVQGQT